MTKRKNYAVAFGVMMSAVLLTVAIQAASYFTGIGNSDSAAYLSALCLYPYLMRMHKLSNSERHSAAMTVNVCAIVGYVVLCASIIFLCAHLRTS